MLGYVLEAAATDRVDVDNDRLGAFKESIIDRVQIKCRAAVSRKHNHAGDSVEVGSIGSRPAIRQVHGSVGSGRIVQRNGVVSSRCAFDDRSRSQDADDRGIVIVINDRACTSIACVVDGSRYDTFNHQRQRFIRFCVDVVKRVDANLNRSVTGWQSNFSA